MGAIDALKEKDGSNKSTIGKHIESTYRDLPAGHINSLTEHLNKLKEDGELVLVKNNYMRPDPNAPPKRGRGRPPKAKDLNAPEVPVVAAPAPAPVAPAATPGTDGSSRGRGRPRKDPNAPPSVKKAKTEKPKEDDKEEDKEDPTPSKSGRPRGRPRKVQPALGQNGVEAN